jgi:hypothetical protein
MNPTESYSFEGNIAVLMEMAGQADRFAGITAALAKKQGIQGIPPEKFEGTVFNDLDRLTAWAKAEVEKFGRPLNSICLYPVNSGSKKCTVSI